MASPFIASPFIASLGAALDAGLGAASVLVGALLVQLARVAVNTKPVTKPMILKFISFVPYVGTYVWVIVEQAAMSFDPSIVGSCPTDSLRHD
jgi:hypothetical protein